MDAWIFVHKSVSVLWVDSLQSHKISHFPQLGDEDEDSIRKGLQNDLRPDISDDF